MKGKICSILLATLCAPLIYAQTLNLYLQKGHEYPVTALEFNNAGNQLLSLDSSGTYLLWDFFARQEVNRYSTTPLAWKSYQINSHELTFELTEDKSRIVCKRSGKKFYVIPEALYDFAGLAVNASTANIAYFTTDEKLVFLRNTQNLSSFEIIRLPSLPTAITFHPSLANLLVIGMHNGEIISYDISERKTISILKPALFKTDVVHYNNLLKKAFVVSDQSSFVITPPEFEKIRFLSMKTNKEITAYSPIAEDSSSINFYYWNNYRIYKGQGEEQESIARLWIQSLFNKVITPVVNLGIRLGSFRSVSELLLHPQNIQIKAKFVPTIRLSDKKLYVNKNQEVLSIDLKSKQKKSYTVFGKGTILYDANAKHLAAWREPSYLTVYKIDQKSDKTVSFVEGVRSLTLLNDSDSLILQGDGAFRIVSLSDVPKVLLTQEGKFINYSQGKIFFLKDSTLQCLSTGFSPIVLPKAFQIKTIEEIWLNGSLAYSLFFNFGYIMLVDSSAGIIASMFLYNNGEYLIVTPENYFFASSKKLLQQVTLSRSTGQSFSLGQFELLYNRPDTVLQKLGITDTLHLQLLRSAYKKNIDRNKKINPSIFVSSVPPEAEIVNLNTTYLVKDSSYDCELHFASTDAELSSINVAVNDSPLWGENGLNLSARHLKKLDTVLKVPLINGDNYIRPSCIDGTWLQSRTVTYFVKATYVGQSIVHYLGIGANKYADVRHNLNYAAEDIVSIGNMIRARYKEQCDVKVIVDQDVTKDNILRELDRLQRCSVNDRIIVFYSGHGLLNNDFDLYLGTYGIQFEHPNNGGVNFVEFEEAINKIRSCRKLLLIDACHSGEIDKEVLLKNTMPTTNNLKDKLEYAKRISSERQKTGGVGFQESFELMKDVFSDLTDHGNTVIISAARGNQFANEGYKWGNGAFTYAVKLGLIQNRADQDGDGKITVNELKEFVITKVEELSEGRQKPTARRELLDIDWTVW